MEKALRTVLDHLGNTAIYVIAREDHRILYFNERVRQVTPQVALGQVCHELWAGNCANCPLLGMGEEETRTTTNYNDPFGSIVELTATRMEWGPEQIPAYLISVIPSPRSEEALRREREAVYDSVPGGVVVCLLDERFTFVEANSRFVRNFGSPRGNGTCRNLIHPEDREAVMEEFYVRGKKGESVRIEYRMQAADGRLLWVLCTGKQIGARDGVPVYLYVLTDITEHKLMELQLEQERNRYRMAVERSVDVLFEYFPIQDLFCLVENRSRSMGRSGRTTERFLERLANFDLIAPQSLETFRAVVLGEARQGEVTVRVNCREPWQCYLCQGESIRQNGRVVRTIVTMRNIEDVKRRQEDLSRRERVVQNTLDAVIGQAFDRVLYLNLTKGLVEWRRDNGKFCKPRHGFDFRANLIEDLHPEDRERGERLFAEDSLRSLCGAEPVSLREEVRLMGADGAYHWAALQIMPLNGNPAGEKTALLLLSGIDARKRLEQETKLLTASVLALFGELIVLDLKSGLFDALRMDASMAEVVTSTKQADFDSFNRRYGAHLVHPDDRKRFFATFLIDNLRRAVAAGKRRFSMEVRRRAPAGKYRWCELIGTVVAGEEVGGDKLLLTFRDNHELRRAQKEQRAANLRFISAVNSFYDAITEGDLITEKLSVWRNERSRLRPVDVKQGYTAYLREICETCTPPEWRAELWNRFDREALLAAFRAGETQVSLDVPTICADGEVRWFSRQVQLLTSEKQAVRIMIYVKDIDDQRRREEEDKRRLEEALALAERASAAKSDFLSRMSHDIRTPMNAIIGLTAIARAHAGEPDYIAGALRKIGMSAKFLLSLINDVLDMSKIESGKMTVVAEPFDFGEFLAALTTMCRVQAAERGQTLDVAVADGVARRYLGDSLRLHQVLMNLLNNAMKFSPDGGRVELAVTLSGTAGGRDDLVLTVRDFGAGMSEDFQRRLFQPFEQERTGGGRVFEGTGLGLAITKSLVTLMGGTIEVESRLGIGSAFFVRLSLARAADESVEGTSSAARFAPLRELLGDGGGTGPDGGSARFAPPFVLPADGQETAARAGAENQAPQDRPFAGQRVLLVEDNDINAEIAAALLESYGLRPERAENGRVACERFADSAPGSLAAVLMDIRMPVMDGLEATRRIRALDRPDAAAVPVIAMSANAFSEEQAEARRCGVNAYLTKPIDAGLLLATLREWIRA